MGLSFSHLALVVLAIFFLFGAGRFPKIMEDLGKGFHSFKKGLNETGDEEVKSSKITHDQSKKSDDIVDG